MGYKRKSQENSLKIRGSCKDDSTDILLILWDKMGLEHFPKEKESEVAYPSQNSWFLHKNIQQKALLSWFDWQKAIQAEHGK